MTSSEVGPVNVKSIYRAVGDNLKTDFFVPCLQAAISYDRAAGYFSSGALYTWATALCQAERTTPFRVRLITSPQLSDEDARVVGQMGSSEERQAFAQKWGDRLLEDLLRETSARNDPDSALALLAWLLVNEWMEIRIAVPISGRGIYHEKIGVFRFPDGTRIAFLGSANETATGHDGNGEMLAVFRSSNDHEFANFEFIERAFEQTWSSQQLGVATYKPSPELLKRLKKEAERWGRFSAPAQLQPEPRSPPWPHQQQAIEIFLQNRRGILEMATGTGKTRTAMEIACNLLRDHLIDGFIISTDGNDLLRQWHAEILSWQASDGLWQRVYREYESSHEIARFAMLPSGAVLICARHSLHVALARLPRQSLERLLVIHDEVHGAGAPQKRADLSGAHANVNYVLGLSATPDREYDSEGTQFITTEIGPVIFRFGLEDAIRAGILCELDYTALGYQLTAEDKKRIEKVWAIKAARAHEGRSMSDEEVAILIANVYKTAEEKPPALESYLLSHPNLVRNTIVFVATVEFGESLLPILHKHTRLYRTYYADDDVANLHRFCNGEIDCLVTCHKLSQGIDIPKLQNVILVSSDKARLETIQRIGRCLRRHPGNPSKRALVVDFLCSGVAPEKNPDLARSDWLTSLASIRRPVT